jgi:ABC-2 type transport system ATP-binding protein
MPDSSIIQTQRLSKTYGDLQAVKNLDLVVPKNSIFGFLGPNGAGKTTTMKLLLGLIRPSSGGAKVFGMDSVKDSVEIRSRIGYLPQDPRFYEFMTAREILDFTVHFFFKSPEAEIKKRVGETLDLVGLSDKADRPVKSFSGGERQRLGIAQAQVNYPDLLILDEPAASLDPLGRHDVLEVLSRLRKHATIFYSTHILDDVQHISDTVAILNRGELAAYGPISTLLAGNGAAVYNLTLRRNLEQARALLQEQPWVADVQKAGITQAPAGQAGQPQVETWLVTARDEKTAEERLLRTLLTIEPLTVIAFGRKTYELEDVFIDIVEGGSHERK